MRKILVFGLPCFAGFAWFAAAFLKNGCPRADHTGPLCNTPAIGAGAMAALFFALLALGRKQR